MPNLAHLSAHSGIPQPVLAQIIAAAQKHAQRVVLYGSRARGDHKPKSDIDIAFYGDTRGYHAFADELDSLSSLLKVDIAFITQGTNPAFLANVRKDGIVLMEKAHDRAQQFSNALDRLAETTDLYLSDRNNAIYRDALIQRFEFTYEVAWKSLKDYLNEIGIVDIRSPRGAIQEAYAQNLITTEQESAWVDIIKSRNLTTHMYDEALISEIAAEIAIRFLPAFRETLSLLRTV